MRAGQPATAFEPTYVFETTWAPYYNLGLHSTQNRFPAQDKEYEVVFPWKLGVHGVHAAVL